MYREIFDGLFDSLENLGWGCVYYWCCLFVDCLFYRSRYVVGVG